jgi:tetratricopeptide (TPR) repeat protein
MRKIVFFILIFLLLPALSVFPQSDDELVPVVKYIYSCKFDSSKILIDNLIQSKPDSPKGYFFNVLTDWWKINIDRKNESLDDPFNDKVDKTVDICDVLLDKNPDDFEALFYKGGALGYRGLLKSIREKWLSAADDGKQALNLMDKALEINPKNKEALLGIGIYNYFAEYVPARYPFLKPLLIIFPKGDKVKGLAQIKEAAQNSKIASYEAHYILAYLNMNYEKNYTEGEIYASYLANLFPENPVFERMLYSCFVGRAKFPEALDGWMRIRNKNKTGVYGYNNDAVLREADYYITLTMLKLGNIDLTDDYIYECEKLNDKLDKDDSSFKSFTYLMLGMKSDAAGDRQKAIDYYKRVLEMKEFGNSQQDAKKYIKEAFKK